MKTNKHTKGRNRQIFVAKKGINPVYEFLLTAFIYFWFVNIGSMLEKNNPYIQHNIWEIFLYITIIFWFIFSSIVIIIIKAIILFIIKKLKKNISINKQWMIKLLLYIIIMFLPISTLFNFNIYKKINEEKIIIRQEQPIMTFIEFINKELVSFNNQEKSIDNATNNDSIRYSKYLKKAIYQDSVFIIHRFKNVFDKNDTFEVLFNSDKKMLKKTFCDGKVIIYNRAYFNVKGINLTRNEFYNLKFSYLLKPKIPKTATKICFNYYRLDIPSELSQNITYEIPLGTELIITNEITKIDTFENKKKIHWNYKDL